MRTASILMSTCFLALTTLGSGCVIGYPPVGGDEETSESGDGDGDGDGDGATASTTTGDGDPSTGDGDGDGGTASTTTGDGDGDPNTGDGDGDGGTASTTTGDGDGDPNTGDGDGDPNTGDGDGDPNTGDGDGDPGSCDAMDAVGVGPCEIAFGVAWNGQECEFISGCECEGVDCNSLFQGFEECEQAYAECANNGLCAGLDFDACEAAPGCMVINGAPISEDPDGLCTLDMIYLGCSSQQGCGDAISFACDGEGIYQTLDTCIPDVGFESCDNPGNLGDYPPCE